jgi:hypothetical protein
VWQPDGGKGGEMNGPYAGPLQRTFQQAVIYLLETQYRLLGSERILTMLTQDIQNLVEQFYPQPERLAPGWMIYTGTRASGKKAHPGQRAADHELVTLAWPVLLPEDVEALANCDKRKNREAWWRIRLIRILEHGYAQPEGEVLLTQADLACMLGLTSQHISQLLQKARQETGKALLTKGYYFDQGVKPTHKAEIIACYEAGLDEADIAVKTNHAQDSVGQYIRDYERVKLMVKSNVTVETIPFMIGMQPSLVNAYAKLIAQYHPELLPVAAPSPQEKR